MADINQIKLPNNTTYDISPRAVKLTETNDILKDAENLSAGRGRFYYLSGVNYTGSLPHGNFAYGTGIALRRFSDNLSVILFSSGTERPAINRYNGSKWTGWADFMGNAWG